MHDIEFLKKQLMQKMLKQQLTSLQKGQKDRSFFYVDHETVQLLLLSWLMKDDTNQVAEVTLTPEISKRWDDMLEESKEAFESLLREINS